MKKKNLSFDEIEKARALILKEYDHYIVQYMKPRRLKTDFEDRYLSALKARMDMASFLHAEMTTVKELRRNEEERINRENEKAARKASSKGSPKVGFADRIVQQNREKIMKYPDRALHPDASFEVRRLFGAMNEFEQKMWPDIERCMRKISPTLYSGPRIVLERRIFDLWSDSKEGVSPRLAGYIALFHRFPRNVRDIDRDEQRFIIDSAYLLHEIADEIKRMKENDILAEKDRNFLEKMFDYVHTVISDFRLTDFKAQ